MSRLSSLSLVLGGAFLAAACSGPAGEDAEGSNDAITSNAGNVLELSFKASVIGAERDTARKTITSQLIYLQGALTTDVRGNAQAGMPTIVSVQDRSEGSQKRFDYEVKIAMTFPKRVMVPTTYDVILPRDTTKLEEFNRKYDGACGRSEYGQDTFWHDWNPKAEDCTITDSDVVRARADVKVHPQKTDGKYPEYKKIWEDDQLDVAAVYGIISGNSPDDEAFTGREALFEAVSRSLQNVERKDAPARAGVLADTTVSGTFEVDGRRKRVNVTAIVVQEAAHAGAAFEERWATVSAGADVLIYDGHSGLGKNIATFSSTMGATAGKYQLVYLFGCQTLGYLAPDMHEKRIALNGAANDPEGTKFLDVIATALPAYGDSGRSNIAIYDAVLDPREPKTFNNLLDSMSRTHLSVVFGEHDNSDP